jgi:hypothetical protein
MEKINKLVMGGKVVYEVVDFVNQYEVQVSKTEYVTLTPKAKNLDEVIDNLKYLFRKESERGIKYEMISTPKPIGGHMKTDWIHESDPDYEKIAEQYSLQEKNKKA